MCLETKFQPFWLRNDKDIDCPQNNVLSRKQCPWLYCLESIITLQKSAKSLIFYSEKFFGHHFSTKPGSHIFLDKWNVEADSESLLKNLQLLPYSILMPDHSIKLYFTGSKDIQIWEYLRAHICSQKILLTPNWIWKKWLVWHKFFEMHSWE